MGWYSKFKIETPSEHVKVRILLDAFFSYINFFSLQYVTLIHTKHNYLGYNFIF